MESTKIYEESLKELTKISRSLTDSEKITIDFSKLDNESKGALRVAITNSIFARKRAINAVISIQ